MSDLLRELAGFTATDRAAWRAAVEATLKGRSYDDALRPRTAEHLTLDPLYTRADLPAGSDGEVPGAAPFTRGWPAPGDQTRPRRGWVRGVEIAHADAGHGNALLLQDLDGGAQRIVVKARSARAALGRPADEARRLAASGTDGVWIDDHRDLEALLQGVQWSLAPVSVLAPAGDLPFTQRLFELCAALRASGGAGLSAQLDLLGSAWMGGDVSAWLAPVVTLIASDGERAQQPGIDAADARPLLVATTALRHAGADTVQELATALGLFVATARAFDGVVPLERLLRLTEFRLAVGNDFFGEIAKLRAFRRALAVVLEALGLTARAGDVLVTAVTAAETLTRHDVHVNLLRTTAQATAAVLGGADALIVLPFDTRLGGGTALSRRLARNLHSLLGEEADAGAVVDPAGGSFYLEARTEQTAAAAWRQFAAWEAAGGFVAACATGVVATALGERREARIRRERSRRDPVLGVSVFPPQATGPADAAPFDAAAFVARWQVRIGPVDAVAAQPSRTLPVRYLGEDFEPLHDQADRVASAGGSPLRVYGVLMGHPAAYAARLDWARDLLAVAGITLLEQAGDDVTTAAAGYAGSGAIAALIVAPDSLHGSAVASAAAALRAAGAGSIVIAGRPGEHERAHRDAGVTGYAFAGADAVSFLSTVLHRVQAPHAAS